VAAALAVLLTGLLAVGVVSYRWFTGPTCRAVAGGQSFAFSPAQTRNAAIITAIAMKRGLPARAATIAIATAIQESGMINISHGDRDSLGLFQQRPSQGWGTPEQILDPVYSTNAFYDALIKVDNYTEGEITAVAQAVQRSAYPEAYADHEGQGRVLASTLSGHSPAGLACRLSRTTRTQATSADITAALVAEMGQTGTAERDGTITVHTSSTRAAWAVAEWAVASADAFGFELVTVANREWRRGAGRGALDWGTTDAPFDGTTVTLTPAS
jgi:hypothetical protein